MSRPSGRAQWSKFNRPLLSRLNFHDKPFNLRPRGKYSTRLILRADNPKGTTVQVRQNRPFGYDHLASKSFRSPRYGEGLISKRFKKVAKLSPASFPPFKSPVPVPLAVVTTILQPPLPQKQILKIKSLEESQDSLQKAFETQVITGKSKLKKVYEEVGQVIKPPPTSIPPDPPVPPVSPVHLLVSIAPAGETTISNPHASVPPAKSTFPGAPADMATVMSVRLWNFKEGGS